jgi:hypothetical protein
MDGATVLPIDLNVNSGIYRLSVRTRDTFNSFKVIVN